MDPIRIAVVGMQRGQVEQALGHAHVVAVFAAQVERTRKQLVGEVAFAKVAPTTRKLRVERRCLRGKLLLFAIREFQQGLHLRDAVAGVAEQAAGIAAQGGGFQVQAVRRKTRLPH